METVITTGGRPDENSLKYAKEAQLILGYAIIERKKRSIARIQGEYNSSVLVAGTDRYELFKVGTAHPLFFHPNSAAFRLKRLQNDETDPLIEVSALKQGDTFLDCTLGFAADSIVASFVVGPEGIVKGIEGERNIAFLTKIGLQSFETKSTALKEAMGRIDVIQMEAITFLESQPDNSWDIVYLDPMFSERIEASSNFTPLRAVGLSNQLTEKWIQEAIRVSKRRVVVKDHFRSPVFKLFHFERIVRPNAKFHFGFISKKQKKQSF